MALPAHILERLPPSVRQSSWIRDANSLLEEAALQASGRPLGLPMPQEGPGARGELGAAPVEQGAPAELGLGPDSAVAELLRGEASPGSVLELALWGPASLGTSVALSLCRRAQEEGQRLKGKAALCAFVDPSRSLSAAGVGATGVELERLLVVRPSLETWARVALRLAESRLFSVLVVDTCGLPQAPLELGEAAGRVVRRLGLAVTGSRTALVLLSDRSEQHSLPWPVTRRIELGRLATPNAASELVVRVSKNRGGALEGPCRVAWTRGGSQLGKEEQGGAPSHPRSHVA